MKRFAVLLAAVVISGCCTHNVGHGGLGEATVREYSALAVTLSDFSMKIVAYYDAKKSSVPADFDAKKFFDLLEKIYPDKSRVKEIRAGYKATARAIDDGYSVMLCDVESAAKIMEDLSCHLNRVEIKSWEESSGAPCAFEKNWRPLCK